MIVRKTAIAALASIAMFVASCGNSNSHNQHEEHNHATEISLSKTELQNANRNEKDQLVDAAGHLIVGCPMHKEMVGSEGDKCPKCNYMKMVPITWSLEGIDTVRVTTLSDYNPPMNKQ